MKNKFILLLTAIYICFLTSCSDDEHSNTSSIPKLIPDTYELPVIFHIMYTNADNDIQNIPSFILYKLIDQTNAMLKDTTSSIDMNVKLIAAVTDPSGKTLDEKGIHRVLRSDAGEISCDEFMESKKTEDVKLVWDLNNYVNIYIYFFREEYTSGVAHLPYTPTSNSLPGLKASDYYPGKPINHVRGISLNNLYLYSFSPDGQNHVYDEEAYKTLAHELGHYLGLLHVFSKEDCLETDYCDDTAIYNRDEYITWVYDTAENRPEEYIWDNMVKRTACNGKTFVSHNIMDYEYSYLDQYTPDQRTRTRHVLENSPLIPGPKRPQTTTRASTLEEEPPIIFIRCSKLHH